MSLHENIPIVSFVVNAFNAESYIEECLQSIFALDTAVESEVIVVDDCSQDRTAEVAAAVGGGRIRLVRHERNLNAAASVTEGLLLARGRFIARIDSDDRYRPCFLRQTLPVLLDNPEVGLVYGDICHIGPDGKETVAKANVGARRRGRPAICAELLPILEEYYIPAPTIIARREAWALGLPVPEGRNFCDWHMSIQMARKWKFAYLDEVLADYRLHPTNMHRAMIKEKYGEATTIGVLEELFAAENFGRDHESTRRRVFSANYTTLANKYFGAGMLSDARRCYLAALKYSPRTASSTLFRRLAATYLDPAVYSSIKQLAGRGNAAASS